MLLSRPAMKDLKLPNYTTTLNLCQALIYQCEDPSTNPL